VAGNNRIGIEVQVQFPTIKEMRDDLAEKWKSIKNGFEAKINVGLDGNSLRQLKGKIQSTLDEHVFDVKINTSKAIREISGLEERIKKLDKLIDKNRAIKLDFNVKDMDKTLKDALTQNVKITDEVEKRNKANRDALNIERQKQKELDKTFIKQEKIYKKLKDGKTLITERNTKTDGYGGTTTTTINSSGSLTVKNTDDKGKLIREIASEMKELYRIQEKLVGATKKEEEAYKNQLGLQSQLLGNLKNIYLEKYGTNAIGEKELQVLKKQLENSLKLKQIKEDEAREKREMSEIEREISSALSKVVQLEDKKFQLQKQIKSASEEEKSILQEQIDIHNRIQRKIEEKTHLYDYINDEQRRELQTHREINRLQLASIDAKEKAKKQTEREKQATQELLSQLKEVQKVREKIEHIQSRSDNGGKISDSDRERLGVLKEQLEIEESKYQLVRKEIEEQGLLTSKLKEQESVQKKIYDNEISRIRQLGEAQAKQDQVTAKMREYERVQEEINRLQRDLIFAGLRESQVIQSQVDDLERKRRIILDELESQGHINRARREEIKRIQQAQREQLELNKLRQQARDEDFTGSGYGGGLVDPYQYGQFIERSAMGVFRPIQSLDEAMVGVSKVAEATDEQLKSFAKGSYDVASSLGVNAEEYIKAVEKWVTAGKSLSESQELAVTSMTGAFVGNIEPDLMVKWMSVPLNTYDSVGLTANDIINTMNEVSNNYAVEMEELGKAYMRSAGTVATAGIDFNMLNGLIAGAQESTRMGGERIGTALKTIGINYNNIKGKITEGEANKFETLKSYGLDLSKTDNLWDALNQLNAIKDSLTPTELNEVLYRLAGKEHQSILGGIMSQWDKAVAGAYQDSQGQLGLGLEGSAYKEHAKQADSVRFKVAELENAWKELMYTIGGGEDGVVKVLDAMVKGLQEVNDILQNDKFMTAIKYLLTGIGIHAGFNLWNRWFGMMKAGFGGIRNDAKELKALWKDFRGKNTGGTDGNSKGVNNSNTRTVVTSTGSRATLKTPTHSDNSRNNNNSSNNTTRVYRLNRTSPQRAMVTQPTPSSNTNQSSSTGQSPTSSTDKPSDGKFKKGLNVAGKALNFVPIIGDIALLGGFLAEMAGIDISGKIVGFLDSLNKSTKKTTEEVKKKQEEFEKENSILNGTIEKGFKSLDELEKLFSKDSKDNFESYVERDMNPNKKGVQAWLTEKEFLEVKKQFDTLAEEYGIDIKIEMNDISHIQEKIKELNEELEKLDKEAMKDISDKVVSDSQGKLKAIEEYSKIKLNQRNNKESLEQAKSMLSEFQDKNGKMKSNLSRDEIQLYQQFSAEVERLEKKQKGLDKQLKETGEQIKTYDDALQKNAETLLKQGDNINSVKLKQEDAVIVLDSMVEQYGVMAQEQANLNAVTEQLKNGITMEKDEWNALVKSLPDGIELKGQLINKSYDQIKAEEDTRGELLKTAEQAQSTGEKELKRAEESIMAVGKMAGKEGELHGVLDETKSRVETNIGKAEEFGTKIDEIKEYKPVTIDLNADGDISLFEKIVGFFKTGKWYTEATVSVHEKRRVTVSEKKAPSKSVAIGTGSTSSASVSSAGSLATSPTSINSSVATIDKAKSTKDPNADARVSSDVWRYWGIESYGLGKIEDALKEISRKMTLANENYDKMISLYKEEQKLLKQQKSEYKRLRNAKNSEMNETLSKLRKYGFKYDSTGKITNLGNAKKFKGSKANEVEELLNTWKSLYEEIRGIDQTMRDIDVQIKNIDDSIKDAKIAKELKGFEKQLKRIDKLLQSISTGDTIMGTISSFISEEDSELALIQNETAMNNAKANLSALITEFNKLSKAKVQFEENGESLQGYLEGLGSTILSQADAIIQYQKAINDIEFNRVLKDLDAFNQAISKNSSNIDNNINNLREGLLSGTKLSDLQSSITGELDLSRNNKFEQLAQERITLEKQVQYALDGFAQKNIDREKNVANSILQINAKLYSQLLDMKKSYTNGKTIKFDQIQVELKKMADKANKDSYRLSSVLERYFDKIRDKQDELTKKYSKDMAKALSFEEKESLTRQYIIDNMKLQEEYIKSTIDANKEAIKELQNQLNDSTLTDEQISLIKSQLESYENDIMALQNNLKSAIQSRFEYEFSLLRDALEKYDEYASQLEYTMNLLDLIGGNHYSSRGIVYNEILITEKARSQELANTLRQLEDQLSLYEKGSYEWNLILEQVQQYSDLLKESNLQLLQINKNIMSNSFADTLSDIEKVLFDGKSYNSYSRYKDLWMDGLEREIALDDTYQRLTELETNLFDEKMKALSKQEKLSRFEMEYLNKQIDILELQKKLNNLNNERTVQVLRQQADGTWDWSYEADATQIEETKDALSEAELALEQLREQAREEYLSKLQDILNDAENGEFENIQELEDALKMLSDAYSTILEEFPEIQDDYLKDLVNAYSKFIKDQDEILGNADTPLISDHAFNEFNRDIVKVFKDISDNIGESIASVLMEKLPSYTTPPANKVEDRSISITLERIEFPNITSSDGIKDAILSLPQVALQKSKGKK
jgi:TP901 family phage tail tape measure protein